MVLVLLISTAYTNTDSVYGPLRVRINRVLSYFYFQWREEGHLSLRMRIPGNMWVEVWQSARSVPVRRQKRLFDETKEAEKVPHDNRVTQVNYYMI